MLNEKMKANPEGVLKQSMCITWIYSAWPLPSLSISVKTEAWITNGSEGFWCVDD